METPGFQQQVTFLYTSDLTRAAAFYRDILGLPLVLDQGTCQIFRVSREAFVGVCQRAGALMQGGEAPLIVTLVSDQVDAWYAYLCTRGVTIEQPPAYHERFNIYHCFLRDTDGHLLEIQQFRDPAWPVPHRHGEASA